MAKFLMERDLSNLNKYFSRLGVKVLSAEESYALVTGYGKS